MATKLINDTYLKDIAKAIREKKGITSSIITSQMANEIRTIPTGTGSELTIINGVQKNAISESGNISANNFIHIEKPFDVKNIKNLQLGAGDSLVSRNIHWIEEVENNKFLIFYYIMDNRNNAGQDYYDFNYILFTLSDSGSINTLSSGVLPCPYGSRYYNRLKPTRPFKANNGMYVFQASNYLQPFSIVGSTIKWGTAFELEGVIQSQSPSYPYTWNQNKTSYGTYGTDWVIYAIIDGGSGSSSSGYKWRISTISVQLNSNTSSPKVQKAAWHNCPIPTATVRKYKDANIYPLPGTGNYFIGWTEYASGGYIKVVSPLTVSMKSDGYLDIKTGNYQSKDAALYTVSNTYSDILYTQTQYKYLFLPSDPSSYLYLNEANSGYNASYSSTATQKVKIKGFPETAINNVDYGVDTYTGGQTFSSYVSLGDGYYGWLNHKRFVSANGTGYTHTYYLWVIKEVGSELHYAGTITLLENSQNDWASLGKKGNYLWLVMTNGVVNIYKYDFSRNIVKLVEGAESIDGVTKTDITNQSGIIWTRP